GVFAAARKSRRQATSPGYALESSGLIFSTMTCARFSAAARTSFSGSSACNRHTPTTKIPTIQSENLMSLAKLASLPRSPHFVLFEYEQSVLLQHTPGFTL